MCMAYHGHSTALSIPNSGEHPPHVTTLLGRIHSTYQSCALNSKESFAAVGRPQQTPRASEVHTNLHSCHSSATQRTRRKALAERKPLAAAHTCMSSQKCRKYNVRGGSELFLDHLQPLASLPMPGEARDAIHLAVSGAVVSADQIKAIASGKYPPLFASLPVAPDALWVPPTVVPKVGSMAALVSGAYFLDCINCCRDMLSGQFCDVCNKH
jgi:hypothetical protein